MNRFVAFVAGRPRPGIRLIALTTGLVVLLAAAAGLATPPDALWINGVYDGADFDDLIAWLTSADGLPVDHQPAAACPPSSTVPWRGRPPSSARASVRVSPAPRAPPDA